MVAILLLWRHQPRTLTALQNHVVRALCGAGGPVVLLREGRLAKLREELVEAI